MTAGRAGGDTQIMAKGAARPSRDVSKTGPQQEFNVAVLTEVSERTVVSIPGRPRGLARLCQFIDYAFWLLYTLLFIRLLLVFFDASSWAGFVRGIHVLTDPFYAPFRGIVPSQTVDGGFTLAIPILIAMVAYGLLHLAIHKLLRLIAYRRTAV